MTPQDPVNPPGLAQIAYRAGDFASFRRALLSPLPGEQQLAGWAPGAGDLGLQALEWWAYLADILTFYNERIANGSYLGTAAAQPGPQHAAALVRLIGYLASPAVTATGVVAAIRGVGAQDGPLVIPAGLQIASTPAGDAPAQLFEVTDGRTFTGPSDALIGLPADPALFQPAADGTRADNARTVLLAGQVAVAPGDQFVLVNRGWDGTTADWAVVTAQSAVPEKDPAGQANTRLTLSSSGWHGLADGAAAAPAPGTPLAADYQLRRAPSTALLWTMPAGAGARPGTGPAGPPDGPAAQTLTVPLATLVRSLSPGDNVLFTGSTGGASPRDIRLLAQVTGYTEEVARVPAAAAGTAAARSQPDVFISHTNVTVRTAGASEDVSALRSVLGTPALGGIAMRYGFRDVGTLTPAPASGLDKLPVTVGVPAGMRLPGGPVVLEDANGTALLVTPAAGAPGSVTLMPADGGSGAVTPALRAPIRLLADLVTVSRGTTVRSEVLGDGDPAAAGQAFVLQHSPLTYLPPAEPGGDPVSTLSVSVDGTAWDEVRTFSGQPHNAAVYVVSVLPDGGVQVRFGDGVNGARLPLGTGNVTASYRYGPVAPPPPAGALSTVLQPQPNLATVRNPFGIVPGTGPEPAGQTARAAPATVVLLPGATSDSAPLISLSDSERLAATVSGVTRVRAYWTWDPEPGRPAITVYVGSEDDTDAAVTAVGRLFPRGTARVPLSAAPARGIGLAVDCRLLCSPGASEEGVRAAVTGALTGTGGLFSPRRMAIGQRLYRSQVEAALMTAGVAAVLGLRVHRPGQDSAAGASVLDPGQDGYFSLQEKDLSISVVIR